MFVGNNEFGIFQSTLPREERPSNSKTSASSSVFQSTLPREERLKTIFSDLPTVLYFNPRSHERSDQWEKLLYLFLSHFNPRSHERSDSHTALMIFSAVNFNPRSHERSDSNIAQKICLFLYNTDNKYIIR